MGGNSSIRLNRLADYGRNAERSNDGWNRLVWSVTGNELIFIRAGSEFEIEKFSNMGWVMEFNQLFAMDYLERYPDAHNHALVTKTTLGQFSLPLTEALRSEMNELAVLLSHAQQKGQSELYLQAYADLIFLNANQLYAKQNGSV